MIVRKRAFRTRVSRPSRSLLFRIVWSFLPRRFSQDRYQPFKSAAIWLVRSHSVALSGLPIDVARSPAAPFSEWSDWDERHGR